MKQIGVALSCLKLNDRVQYKSYYPADEILNVINEPMLTKVISEYTM